MAIAENPVRVLYGCMVLPLSPLPYHYVQGFVSAVYNYILKQIYSRTQIQVFYSLATKVYCHLASSGFMPLWTAATPPVRFS